MTIETSVDPSGHFVLLSYGTDEPTPEETFAALMAIFNDPSLPPSIGILIDGRGQAAPSPERVKMLSTAFGRQASLFRGRRIAVVYRGIASYGMLRMAKALGSDIPSTLGMFETMEEAETWLRN